MKEYKLNKLQLMCNSHYHSHNGIILKISAIPHMNEMTDKCNVHPNAFESTAETCCIGRGSL